MKRKDVEVLIGKERMIFFDEFMKGKTVGLLDNKEIDYYTYDVLQFMGYYNVEIKIQRHSKNKK